MKAGEQTFHLSVNLLRQNDQLHAHALELGMSVEADSIPNALRKLADEIDKAKAAEQIAEGAGDERAKPPEPKSNPARPCV